MPAGRAARAPRASTAASPKQTPPNRTAPPRGAALASKHGKNGISAGAADLTTNNIKPNTKPGHSSSIATTNSPKDATTTNSDSEGAQAIQAIQQQLNEMTKEMRALQATLQQVQLKYHHHDEHTNNTENDNEPPSNNEPPSTKDQTNVNKKDQQTNLPEGHPSRPIPRRQRQRRTTPKPSSGTTKNMTPPETRTPVGLDMKNGNNLEPTSAYNKDMSAATENTTAGTDVHGDPIIGRQSAEPRIPAPQSAQRVPTPCWSLTRILAQQEAGQKRTRQDSAANRTAEETQGEQERTATAGHHGEREQISGSNLQMILAFLQANGRRKLANHIRRMIRAGEEDMINAQLQAASIITRKGIEHINGFNGTTMQMAQELMIHTGTQAIRICETMGFIGGCAAHQMETRIMEAAERVNEVTRAILQELTAAAEPGFDSRRFVPVTGQQDRHRRNPYNQARQRKPQLEELARKAPELERHELQEGVQQAVTSLYYTLKGAACRNVSRSTAAQRMAKVLQQVTTEVTDIVKRNTWSKMPYQLKNELLNTARNIAEAETAGECDVQRAISYIVDMATTLFSMQSEWVERTTDEGSEQHATELDGAQIVATIRNIRASMADCKQRQQASHMQRLARKTATKAAMRQWRCWQHRVTHHLSIKGTQPKHQQQTREGTKTYREAATGNATRAQKAATPESDNGHTANNKLLDE